MDTLMDILISFLVITSAILIGLGGLVALMFVGYAAYVGGGILPVVIYTLIILGLSTGGKD